MSLAPGGDDRPGLAAAAPVPTSFRVAYRDEAQALRARIDQLEGELGSLRRENASLRGVSSARATGHRLSERMLGGKVVIAMERDVDAALPASAHDRVLDVMRTGFGSIGETSVVGGALSWRVGPRGTQRAVEVAIATRGARTHVRIVERLGGLAGGLFGGVVGGAGGGALGVVVPLLATFDPALGLVAGPAWIGCVYTIVRNAYGATARRRERQLSALMDTLERTIRASTERDARIRGQA